MDIMSNASSQYTDSKVPLTVRLVLDPVNQRWILGKFAVRLAENLPKWNVEADISDQPSPTADINHWISFLSYPSGKLCSRNTLFVSHVDRPAKLLVLKKHWKKVDVYICMSRMTVEELVRRGIKREKLCYITPAHDGLVTPRRITIGITSRTRADKAKREDLLIKLADMIRLDAFRFEIIGRGWEEVIPHLEAAGATVRYYPGTDDYVEDYKINLEHVATFDYYLYMGFDEGSMGFLDALAAGVPTIVTPQGYHLDINGGITHPFSDAVQLSGIFRKLAWERQRLIDSVSGLTWNEYARQHAVVWRALLRGRQSDISMLLHEKDTYTTPLPRLSRMDIFVNEVRFYTNTNFRVFYADLMMLAELYTGVKVYSTAAFRAAARFKRFIMKRLFSPTRSKKKPI